MNKLLFTGGHHNSAVALIDWLKSSYGDKLLFVWVGKKNSPEYAEVTERNIKFYNIKAGKLFRTASILYIHKVIFNLLLIPLGFFTALVILFKERPTLVVSFGGFIALPVVVAAKLLGIRSVTHEQTTTIGLANSLISRFVDKIYVSWPLSSYPNSLRSKMVFTGLPLRSKLFEKNSNKHFVFKNKKPVLYATGGKSGASVVNKYISDNIEELLDVANIIWQVGSHSEYNDIKHIEKIITNLAVEKRKCVVYKPYYNESEVGEIFSMSNLVVSRGGAHTVYELLAFEIPGIIIPIPWSSNNEQFKNAKYFESSGLGVLIDQQSVSSERFLEQVKTMLCDLKKWKIKDNNFKVILDGQERLGNEIKKYLT